MSTKSRRMVQWMAIMACAWAVHSQATDITVSNPSFETPPNATNGYYSGSYITFHNQTAWWPSFNSSGQSWDIGLYQPAPVPYPGGLPDGLLQVAYIEFISGWLWQDTSKPFLADEVYTLSAAVGQRANLDQNNNLLNPYAPSTLELWASSAPAITANDWAMLKSVPMNVPDPGTFRDTTLTFGPGDPGYASLLTANQNKYLIVVLDTDSRNTVSGETDWDNVRFSYAAYEIPEPASLALLGLGGLMLVARRRKLSGRAMRFVVPVAAAVLALALAQGAQAMTFADFELPTYPATNASGSVSIDGVDNWHAFRGTVTLTPDPAGSGVLTVLEGSQSAYVSGSDPFVDRPWGSTVSAVSLTQTVVSTLGKIGSGGMFYLLSDTAIGSGPAGIEGHGNGYFYLFRAGSGINQATTVPFDSSHVYRLSMALDILNWQFTPTIEDLTAHSITNLGAYAMFPQSGQQSLTYVQNHGGLGFTGTGVWDDIQVNAPAVPEPASLALLGLGGLMLLVRRRKLSDRATRIAMPVAAVVLALALAQGAQAMTFADFEQSSGYPAAPASFIGYDGWATPGGSFGLTPDPYPPGSGYTAVLEGSQSAWNFGWMQRGWGSTVSLITDTQTVISTLVTAFDGSGNPNLYFSNDLGAGGSPGGIEWGGSQFNIYCAAGSVNSGVSSDPTHVYKLSMALDIPNWQFTPTIEDLTVPSTNTPGTYAMYLYPYPAFPAGMMTLPHIQAYGGLIMTGTGVWDDIQVIPEPVSLALLGLGAVLLLLRRVQRNG